MSDLTIETERLYIRQIAREDLPRVQKAKVANWAELQKWMVWASDDQKPFQALVENYETRVLKEFTKGALRLVARHKDTNEYVMFSGLDLTDKPDVYSTGYWGNAEHLGRGYATEVTKAILKYAFNEKNAQIITIQYYEGNIASKRVIEKCGFQFVNTAPKAHQTFASGEWLDVHQYEMTKKRYRELTL